MLSSLKNMQQVDRKYLRNLSIQPAKEKKKSLVSQAEIITNNNYRHIDDFKRNVIKNEYFELMKKNKRPKSNGKRYI
jgi:hypothetical protein